MESTISFAIKKMLEHKTKTLEEETMLGLYDIIGRMHKHTVGDYIALINPDEDDNQIINEPEFNERFKKNFFEMFKHIEDDLEYRVQDLKSKLMKRFDIEESSIESESESESENIEIKNKYFKSIFEKNMKLKLLDYDKTK